MAQNTVRRVIFELKNGQQVAGEFVEERSGDIQKIIVNGITELLITGISFVIKKDSGHQISILESEIAKVHEASFKSQLK